MIFGGKILGSVRLSVKGDHGEEVLRRLGEEGIPLWDVRCLDGNLSFSVEKKHLPAARRVALGEGCHILLTASMGLPRFWKRVKGKKASWFTALAVFLALWCVLSVAWTVDIVAEKGTELSPSEEKAILAAAEKCGITLPLWKSAEDWDVLSEGLLKECPDLSWVSVSPEGMALVIRVAEKQKDTEKHGDYGNVVAVKNGVVNSIFVLKGQKQAEVGDAVQKGDILISGDICYEEEGRDPVYDRVAAAGTVKARVWYEGVAYVSRKETTANPTGKMAGYVTLSVFDRSFSLWGDGEDPFSDSIVKERRIKLFDVELVLLTYAEAEPSVSILSPKEAEQRAEQKAMALAKGQVPEGAELIGCKTEVLEDKKGALGVKILLECEEEIGIFMNLP